MKVLILSCNTGEGHNYAGRALKECIESHHDTADMLDIMMLASPRVSKLVGNSYVNIVRHAPRLFQCLYKLGGLVSSARHHSPVYYANALLAKKLTRYLDTHHYDVIVTPHLFPAQTLTYIKKKNLLSQKVVAVETDYTCIPFWEETDCDYYIIPHYELIDEFTAKGIPRERLKPYGIPVRPAFSDQSDRQKARVRCGIPTHAQVYLIMSGSMGFGKVHLLAHELVSRLENGEQAVIICGNNKKRMRSLRLQFHKNPNVHIIGFTRHVAEYMAAADVLFTKPGGLSSTEAAVRRVPLVHTDPIPGCETKNRAFFVSRGMSVTGAHQKELAEAGISLACDDARQIAMRDAQRKNSHPQAGTSITHLLEKLVSE